MWKPGPPHSTTSSRCTSALTLRHRHDGAMRDVADRARLAVADQLRADERADAVGADQRRAREAAAIRRRHRDASPRSSKPSTMASGTSSICGMLPAGIEQHVMQVDAVDDDVGMLEARAERRAGRDRAPARRRSRRRASARRAAQSALSMHRVAQAEAVEHVEDIGAELDAVADGAELRRAFEHALAMPRRASASAVVSPPSPPPTIEDGIVRNATNPTGPHRRRSRVRTAARSRNGSMPETDHARNEMTVNTYR